MNKDEKKPLSKFFSIICTVLTVIFVGLTAAVLINLIVCRVKNKPVSFFGTSFAIVQTNSMEPEIMTGDLILFKTCNYDDIKVGDYIVFIAGKGFPEQIQGQSVVHEAREITADGIVTKGVNNSVEDKDKVTADNLLGICTYNSAGWGKFFSFLGKYGILIIIAIIAVPFIIGQIVKIVKLSKQEDGDGGDGSENNRECGADGSG